MPDLPLPPCAPEAEHALLGCVLLCPDHLPAVAPLLSPDSFYLEKHRWIWEAITSLDAEGAPLCIPGLVGRLRDRGVLERLGGLSYLSTLADIPAPSLALYYAHQVREKAALRSIAEAAATIRDEAHSADFDRSTAQIDRALVLKEKLVDSLSVLDLPEASGPVAWKQALVEVFAEIQARHETHSSLLGLSTGYPGLDALTAGLQAGDLILLAGRPSMGKTAFALQLMLHTARWMRQEEQPGTILLCSLEMSRSSLMSRIISSEARVNSLRLRTGQINETEQSAVAGAIQHLAPLSLRIDDRADHTPASLRALCRSMKSQKPGLAMLMIDYLQLMHGNEKAESREREIAEISRSLKALAKELQIPVVVLAQLNRDLEKRQDKRPQLSDLRESGALEQDADLVLFLYRDEVYYEETEEPGVAEVIIGKQRNGPIGTVKLGFAKEYGRFDSLA